MTRYQKSIADSWADLILLTIRCQDADAAYRITRAAVQRFREIGALGTEERAELIRAGMAAAIRVA